MMLAVIFNAPLSVWTFCGRVRDCVAAPARCQVLERGPVGIRLPSGETSVDALAGNQALPGAFDSLSRTVGVEYLTPPSRSDIARSFASQAADLLGDTVA
jgi:hypothetical protein